MQHTFTNETGSEGIWLTPSNQVYCRWQWDQGSRRLIVEAGNEIRAWTSPDLDQSGESGMSIDFAETARDVARLIERQGRRSGLRTPSAAR